jgi:hypothetical protein
MTAFPLPVFSWRSLLLAVATALACSAAAAQWQWVDGSGRKVFSDTPPPPSIPDKDILKRAGAVNGTPAVVSPAAKPEAAPPVPQISGRDEQLEAKRKEAEAQEQALKKVEADRVAKARQENCERAKRSKATLDSGVRMATTNAKGEREIMNDAARAAETQRLTEIIRSSCGSGAQ